MSVQKAHHFSPLWLLPTKQLKTHNTGRSGFATLNGGHNPVKGSFHDAVPIITNITSSYENKTAEFPTLQSARPAVPHKTGNSSGVWSQSRNRTRLYGNVKNAKQPTPGIITQTKTKNAGEGEKPISPKLKTPGKGPDSSKVDFFKSLRLDEGIIDSDSENTPLVQDETSSQDVPLSSSVETEHRLLKSMGWCDANEPPLTEEEVSSARLDIEKRRSPKCISPLSPFPWAPKSYLPNEEDLEEDESESEVDELVY